MLKITSTVWPRVWRAITKSHCWHCSYGLGAPHVRVCLALPSAVYLVQIGTALWQLSLKMRRFWKNRWKRNPFLWGPTVAAVEEDRAGDLGSPCSLNQLSVCFLWAEPRIQEVKVRGGAACCPFKSVLNPDRWRGPGGWQPWPWGCAWSPPALWCAAPGKDTGTLGLGERRRPCKGWNAPWDAPSQQWATNSCPKTGMSPGGRSGCPVCNWPWHACPHPVIGPGRKPQFRKPHSKEWQQHAYGPAELAGT